MASIEKRGESSYRLTVSCGYDKSGKKLFKRKTINLSGIPEKKREAEANKLLILFQEEVEKGIYLDSGKMTFEDFINKWLKDYAEVNLAPKTLARYKEILTTRVIPCLGHLKLNKLQPTHLTEFYNLLREDGIRKDNKYTSKKDFIKTITDLGFTKKDIILKSGIDDSTLKRIECGDNVLASTVNKICSSINVPTNVLFDQVKQESGLSERTILHHHRLISTILTSAVQWQFILNNPAERVKPPKVEKKEAKHFDEKQVQYIFELLENEPLKYKLMVHLSIFCGMRMGELTGLDWKDIDFDNALLRIHQSSQYIPSVGTLTKSPKNESSNRTISIPPSIITMLKEYKVWQNGKRANSGDLWTESGRIFTATDGKPIFPNTPSTWFNKFIRKHNKSIMNDANISDDDKPYYLLPEVNFHGLRHTNATLLISQGVDVTTVSKRLGHARTSTTTDIYSHSLRKTDKEAADKLENLFKTENESLKKQG